VRADDIAPHPYHGAWVRLEAALLLARLARAAPHLVHDGDSWRRAAGAALSLGWNARVRQIESELAGHASAKAAAASG
jgi:hypothetical protein